MRTNQSIESKKKVKNICGGELRQPVDTEDDILMVSLGLRQPLAIRHPELYIKTEYEKKELSRLKASSPAISRTSAVAKEPHEIVEGRLTVYLKNTEKSSTFRTTRTFKCFRNEVNDILGNLRNDRLIINKHYFKY